MEDALDQLAKFFSADEKSAELLTLPCRGIIWESAKFRYGVLFRPPVYTEDLR